MSENQLREAYTLMKQGDTPGATRLVQDVLREDKSNVNAWWLMSHLFDDEEKIIRCLGQVLSLNPEHLGARKKLSEMRPEYSHLYGATSAEKEKAKTDQIASQYWNAKSSKKQRSNSGLLMLFSLVSIFAVFLIIGTIATIMTDTEDSEETVEDSDYSYSIIANMENTPEGLVQAFNEAYYREDIPTLYALSCEAYRPELEEMIEDFDNSHPERISVDFSETEFVLDKNYSNERHAYVRIEGFTNIIDGGVTLRTDWAAMAKANGYDFYGLNLENIDGSWKICVGN
jgi:hypothetical protein